MTIEPNKKNMMWIAGVVLGVLWYAPSILTTERPSAPRPPQPIPPAVAAAMPFRQNVGIYTGRTRIEGRGLCNLRFELRIDIQNPGGFKGYSTLVCSPMVAFRQWRPSLAAQGPKTTSAIMTGTPEKDALKFRIDNIIGAADCRPTGYVVRKFGFNQILLEWQDPCQGGALTLNRTER